MAPSLFITGSTGFIGGDSLYTLQKSHPEWNFTCLVRNPVKGAQVASVYPRIRLVYGDLDSIDLIEEEASKADIVYHFANCDHAPSATAIAKGLARRSAQTPGFWIHTSGGMILALESIQTKQYGERFGKVFNDWEGVHELLSQPDDAPHRDVDKIVIAASATTTNIKTAIVCPPCIYGTGRGPGNQTSMQVEMAAKYSLQRGKAIQIGNGENIWNEVHVHDLSNLYLLLGEAASAGGPPATWNDQGYYLVENGEVAWGDISTEIAKVAQQKGLLKSTEIVKLTSDDAAVFSPWLDKAIGTTSRGNAIRARKLLGWQPKERPLKDTISDVVDSEARKLGLIQGHAAQVEQ